MNPRAQPAMSDGRIDAVGLDADAVIVGAGTAGLAAAGLLRRSGLRTLVLEAGDRIGGRAHTTCPALLGGVAFDHGASWLHAADRNPLAELAREAGDELIDAADHRAERTRVGDRPATPSELDEYGHAYEAYEAALRARATSGAPDCSVREAAAALLGDPWTATTEAWEAPVIAAADADLLSVQDWHRNALTGANLNVSGGLGAFIARRLGPQAGAVRLRTPATAIAWRGTDGVRVHTPSGPVRAACCIVTVSTGVLEAGRIRFDPALPAATQAAIDGLPMGLLTKVALRAAGEDRLDLPPSCSLDHRVERAGDPAMMFQLWPRGDAYAIGFIGGRAAWDLSREGPDAAEAFARAELVRMLGARAGRAFAPGAVVTDWGGDPATLGAYAYARPGAADARVALGMPLDGGALAFAGEACHESLAGTVAGAYVSGCRAASAALAGVLADRARHPA